MRHDLTGQRFGRLTAIEPTEKRMRTQVVWRCVCDCGAEAFVASSYLIKGETRSCGCLRRDLHRKDITGLVKEHLTALYPTDEVADRGQPVWVWQCDCGNLVRRPLTGVGKHSITRCPDCAYKLSLEKVEASRKHIARDDEGRSVKQVDAIREGKPMVNNTSGVRGVYWHKRRRKWVATICDGKGKQQTIGSFRSLEDAKAAREYAVQQKYGDKKDDTR